jgi:KDO2-lipid IV(A) lauroyltransferase
VNLSALAWKWAPRLPAGLVRGVFAAAADLAAWRRGKGVRQLEANLRRVRPELGRAGLRRLVRQAMRRYLRYFGEAFQLAAWPPERVAAMAGLVDDGRVRAELGARPRAVLALGHMGNWDLAGAWATGNLAPVITVAEHLRPEEVFQDFLAMRRRIGLEIIALEPGRPVFGQVLRAARRADQAGRPWLVALLADRDLGRGGVEVQFFGEPALMAPGPAAAALALGVPLHAVAMYRRDGGRDRGWPRVRGLGRGYDLEFSPPIAPPPDQPKARQIELMTQAWATFLEGAIRRHPADWHMLQKVFTADLDPARLAQVPGDAAAGEAGGAGEAVAAGDGRRGSPGGIGGGGGNGAGGGVGGIGGGV